MEDFSWKKKTVLGSQFAVICECPKCGGDIIHNDNFFCSEESCDFNLFSSYYNVRLTKACVKSLCSTKYADKFYTNIFLSKESEEPCFGTLKLQRDYSVKVLFPKDLPVCRCEKCKGGDIIIAYSYKKEFMYYYCTNKECNFYMSRSFRTTKFSFKNVKTLMLKEPVEKTLKSKKNKKYTLSFFLDDDFVLQNKL